MQRKPPSDRIVAAATAVMLHLFVIALLIRADRSPRTDLPEEEHAGILYLLSQSQPQPVRRPPERARAARHGHQRRKRAPAGPRIPILAAPRQPPGVISVPSGPRVDWYHEAEVVAHIITGARGTGVHPGSGEHEHSPRHKCDSSPGFAWDPEPKTVGFIGFMPYLRTKRCFFTLIGFGCAIGRLPEPNGHLLDSIKGGPVVFTSVPDEYNCDK
jgi:hypothetical protein